MNEQRKQYQRDKMKAIWEEAELYASILGKTKNEIYNKYMDVCRKYKDYIITNRDHFIQVVKSEISMKERFQKQKEESLDIKAAPTSEIYLNNQKKFPSKEEREPLDNLKIMLWAIDQIGNTEKAKKIFNAAILALETME